MLFGYFEFIINPHVPWYILAGRELALEKWWPIRILIHFELRLKAKEWFWWFINRNYNTKYDAEKKFTEANEIKAANTKISFIFVFLKSTTTTLENIAKLRTHFVSSPAFIGTLNTAHAWHDETKFKQFFVCDVIKLIIAD